MALKGHVFQTLKVPSSLYCLEACKHEARCQSFNHVMGKDIGELNNRTKEARPEDFISDVTKLYLKKPKNRVALGSIAELPAASCEEIKMSEGQVLASKKYWMICMNQDMAVLTYCNMTTGDIDECTRGTHNCHSSLASCTNTAGSFSCSCNNPYSGDGRTCYLLVSECQNYGSLNNSDRKTTYKRTNNYCDNGTGPGWFRFEGSAGTRMPTSCPPTYRCNTDATGWMNGGQPSVADGQVSRQVCFHWTSGCCQWSTNIKVRNCGSYYVYYLSGIPTVFCRLRYCGTD
ncbi:unnamed protein product [Porites lobata]|uniref:EGF-like domain-containing protein n=1 Tax=Porites lobata TaxID=104759 RepID=A0ABN8P4H2_9CNID|nr:unnamed protein product [Porites lobata]